MICKRCGAENLKGAAYCVHCGASQHVEPPAPPVRQPIEPTVAEQPISRRMGWYKFIIWVQLFASAAVNLLGGWRALRGMQVNLGGKPAQLAYAYFNGLQTLNVCYGLLLMLLGVWALWVRFRLASYRVGAPKAYLRLLAMQIALPLGYFCAMMFLTGLSPLDFLDGLNAGIALSSALLLLVSQPYFDNRERAFRR